MDECRPKLAINRIGGKFHISTTCIPEGVVMFDVDDTLIAPHDDEWGLWVDLEGGPHIVRLLVENVVQDSVALS